MKITVFKTSLLAVGFLIVLFTAHLAAAEKQPYAGQHLRPIKALSMKEISDYKKGAGLGLAKAAELNHYPGHIHLLEFADQLNLSQKQKTSIERFYRQMKTKAVSLGLKIVALEAELDALFATQKINNINLTKLVETIARYKGQLRTVHLSAHLQTRPLLSPQQLAHYDRLRGYGKTSHKNHPHQGH